MKQAKLVLLLVLGFALVLLVAQNTAPVQARFLWLSAEIPAIVLLFLTAAAGFFSGLLAALLFKSGGQPKS